MSIKTIILHLTNDDKLDNKIEVALGLATENGAQVTGVYTITPVTPPTSFMGYIPPEFIERTRAQEAENAEKAAAKLKEAAATVNVDVATFKEEGYALDILNKFALAADLVVIGQVDPDNDQLAQFQYLADELVVSCPAPVLAVPYAGKYHNFGERILVGWNNTREAAGAIQAAMPFLVKADKVTLLNINPDGDQTQENDAIVAHLRRHGVTAELKVTHFKDVGIGNALLDSLVDMGCDMLVMGAYGHSRLREMILGGATQEILEHMTAPVLFKH